MSDTVLAVLLGVIQGLTEFLPVSSSAHLIIVSSIAQGKVIPLYLNVGMHLGTLLAVILYFHKDLLAMVFGSVQSLKRGKLPPSNNMIWPILIGTIPAAVVGLLFKDEIEQVFHNPLTTLLPLTIFGWLLWWIDRKYTSGRRIASLTWSDALIAGVAQATALIPGVSRSGATITGLRFLGLDRQSAARFSFLLGTPAMFGAFILESQPLWHNLGNPLVYIGFSVAFISGLATIHYFLRWLKSAGFIVFAIYRTILAVVLAWMYLG